MKRKFYVPVGPANYEASILALAAVLFLSGVDFAFASGDGVAQCNPLDIAVSTTPVPEQDPATLRDAIEKLSKMPPSADVVVLGDSLARQMTPDIANSIFPGQNVWNYGVGGDLTQNVLWRLKDDRLKQLQPTKVVVFVGTNNLATHKQSGCAIAAGSRAVVDRVKELWTGAEVILVPLLPRGPDFHSDDRTRLEANRLSGAVYIDDVAITCGGYAKPVRPGVNYVCSPEESLTCENFQRDNIHLSVRGYNVIAPYISR